MRSPNPCGIPQLAIGRDVHGRFRPGNPFARKVAALRKTLLDSVSEQDLKDMVETLKLKARQGVTAAIKLLLQYCVGKPESPKDPDRMDADEWDRLLEMRVGEREYEKTVDSVPACLACHKAQTDWPCNVQDGPLAQTVFDAHAEMRADTRTDAAPPRAIAPANQPGESDAPAEQTPKGSPRPSTAKGPGKSDGRHTPAGPSRPDGHTSTQESPLPNGRNGDARRQEAKPPTQPRQPSGQPHGEPPRH